MRNYKPSKYSELVEQTSIKEISNYLKMEAEYISSLDDLKNTTFIELGAGYGRVLPRLSELVFQYIGVEINPDMYLGLEKNTGKFLNAKAIQGDFLKLPEIFGDMHIKKPTLSTLSNTLGTVEGVFDLFVGSIRGFLSHHGGGLLVSGLKKGSLAGIGTRFYQSIEDICGPIDYHASKLSKGLFVSKTGYTSKWWSLGEIITLFNNCGIAEYSIFEKEHFYIVCSQ